jgi:hypothetical protein
MLDVASGDNLAVMHSRRWYWMQNAMGATSYPLITQPGVVAQTLGVNYAEAYGRGIRGVLPNGTPVHRGQQHRRRTLVRRHERRRDLHSSTSRNATCGKTRTRRCSSARSRTKAANLGILLVVYGYFAYTFTPGTRRPRRSAAPV